MVDCSQARCQAQRIDGVPSEQWLVKSVDDVDGLFHGRLFPVKSIAEKLPMALSGVRFRPSSTVSIGSSGALNSSW
jgi:hypothetical protein